MATKVFLFLLAESSLAPLIFFVQYTTQTDNGSVEPDYDVVDATRGDVFSCSVRMKKKSSSSTFTVPTLIDYASSLKFKS